MVSADAGPITPCRRTYADCTAHRRPLAAAESCVVHPSRPSTSMESVQLTPPQRLSGLPTWGPLGVAAAALAWLVLRTSAHGIGLDSDGAQYLAAAASLREGDGWLGVDGAPYTLWPPLYPLCIALLELVGMSASAAVRVLHMAALATSVLLAGSISWRLTGSRAIPSLAAAAVAWTLMPGAEQAWSECAFAVWTLLAFSCLLRWSVSRARTDFAALAAACALAILQRYVGILVLGWIAIGVAWIERENGWSRALRRAGVLTVAALAPTSIWLARNAMLGAADTSRRGAPSDDWMYDLRGMLSQLVPTSAPLEPAAIAAALLLAAGTVLALRSHRGPAVRCLALFPLAFGAGLVVLRHLVEFDPIDERLMSPARALAALVATCALAWLWTSVPARVLALVAALPLGMSALEQCRALPARLDQARSEGLGLYDSPRWRDSEAVQALRERLPEGAGYSNEPHALFLLAGVRTRALPPRAAGIGRLYERWSSEPAAPRWILWFHFNVRAELPHPQAEQAVRLVREELFADAELVRVEPAQD